MPLYEVEYSIPLTKAHKDDLAAAITKIHHLAYGIPSFFISVKFTDGSKNENYSGGNITTTNRIFATVRTSGSRTTADFNKLCESLFGAWSTIVTEKDYGKACELNGVFVLKSMEASIEEGFVLPQPNEDAKWFKDHLAAFQQLADEGHEGFKSVLEELRLSGQI